MAKYFVSFSSTFDSLLKGKLRPADLAEGTLVFGCKRKHVLLPYDQVPIEVLLSNRLKTNQIEKCTTVSRKLIDSDVLDMWDHFAAQIRKANLDNRLLFMHDIGHPSYRRFSQDMVREGHQVFWKGDWVALERPVAASAFDQNVPSGPSVPLPDQAFIDQVLSESAIGSRSIQDYSHR